MSWSSAAVFYHNLGMLLKSGLAMDQALDHAGRASGGWHRQRAAAWAAACVGGRPLAEQLVAAGEHPLSTALVAAGERSGKLPELCQRIADFFDHCRQLRRLVIGRLIYPLVLAHAALLAPALPPVILGRADPLTLLIGPGLLWAAILGMLLVHRLTARSGLGARLMLLPPLRGLTMPLVAGNTCLVVGAGLDAGMLYHQALELAAAACGNRVMAARLRAAAGELASGRLPRLTAALVVLGFPRAVVQLCDNGEVAGTLDQALARAAELERQAFIERTLWTARIASGLCYALALIAAALVVVQMYSGLLGTYHEAMRDSE